MNIDLNDTMRLIQSLSPSARIEFSDFTNKWYVGAGIFIHDGDLLSGITEHQATPEAAVYGFLRVLRSVQLPKALRVNSPFGERFYRWNGAGFVEVQRP